MFTPSDKGIVAAIMAILLIIEQIWGFRLGLGEETVTAILAILTPIFVWLVPNAKVT